MKKILVFMLVGILAFSLIGCSEVELEQGELSEVSDTGGSKDINLSDVNNFLNTSADLGPGTAVNKVEIIPFNHIDGPKNESDLYAFVNFQYEARDFIKYQVSYVSCTCRTAAENYWQTAYVELSLPDSKNPDDVVLRNISFDKDPSGDYLGGLWADSNPTPSGVGLEIYREEYLPFFQGKDNSYLKNLSTLDDIDISEYQDGEGRSGYEIDTFTGSSVSANNIIRITNSIMDYHLQNPFFE